MTAWDKLIANSALETGTAWEHLQNQQGGAGFGVVVNDGIEVELMDMELEAVVDDGIDVEINDTSVEAVLEDEDIQVEIL